MVARRRHAKKVGNVYFLCLVQVTRIYIAVEETLLGLVLASKRVPSVMYVNAMPVLGMTGN